MVYSVGRPLSHLLPCIMYLCSNGPTTLAGTSVEIVIKQKSGVIHLQVFIAFQAVLEAFQPTKHY